MNARIISLRRRVESWLARFMAAIIICVWRIWEILKQTI